MKRALSVGINYPNSPHELRGCVNDSHTIVKMLRERYGFEDITTLHDGEATHERMLEEMERLIDGAVPGDVLFFHYSGHGSQVLNNMGDDDDNEPDGLDEIICPVDFNWTDKMIRDDQLKALFDKVPDGVNLTVFLDCCNSGGGLDHMHEYKYEGGTQTGEDGRNIPMPTWMVEAAQERKLTVKTRSLSRQIDHTGLLISGAQAHQTAADAYIDGMYQGATTYYLQRVLDELGNDATYKEIVDGLNSKMITHNFSQRPQLDGPSSLHNKSFLQSYDFGDEVIEVHEPKPVEDTPKPEPVEQPTQNDPVIIDNSNVVEFPQKPQPEEKDDDDKSDKKKLLLIAAGVAVVAGLIFLFGGY